MDAMAHEYLILCLAMGQIDDFFVDAYYGPESFKAEAKARNLDLAGLELACKALSARLAAESMPTEPLLAARLRYLRGQVRAFLGRIALLQGEKLSFVEEAQRLYDVTPPQYGPDHFKELLAKLDHELPGTGTLAQRLEHYRQAFVIPTERVDAVFQAAIREARKRTLAKISLPEDESFSVEYVTGKPWSGYNWYQGQFHSLIQVNTELPITIDRAVDLACHEGYPGHHVYNILFERELSRARGWQEFSIYALFSPQSLIAEGSANFGIEVCFPGDEKLKFEQEVLYPLAGLDPNEAARYNRILSLQHDLNYAHNEAARSYLEGRIDAAQAQHMLVDLGMMSPARAKQRVGFIEKYRSYVLNYNFGMDLIASYVNAKGGTPDKPEMRWKSFVDLLSRPLMPSELLPQLQ